MLQGEHSAILWTFIKLPFVIKIFVFSTVEVLFYTGFTVLTVLQKTKINIFEVFHLNTTPKESANVH